MLILNVKSHLDYLVNCALEYQTASHSVKTFSSYAGLKIELLKLNHFYHCKTHCYSGIFLSLSQNSYWRNELKFWIPMFVFPETNFLRKKKCVTYDIYFEK